MKLNFEVAIDTRDAEILKTLNKLDGLDSDLYDTCSESDRSEDDGDWSCSGCGDGDSFDEMFYTEEGISNIWRQCQAKFRRSTEDLLSDYVDPVAELHMTLPEWYQEKQLSSTTIAVEVQPTENGGCECLVHHREEQERTQQPQHTARWEKRVIVGNNRPMPVLRHQFVRM